jgi:hypothetical protein
MAIYRVPSLQITKDKSSNNVFLFDDRRRINYIWLHIFGVAGEAISSLSTMKSSLPESSNVS